MSEKISANLSDIKEKKNLIEQKYEELVKMFEKYREMINETSNIYDTSSANYFRLIASQYIDMSIVFLNNNFKVYVDKLDDVAKSYSESLEDVSKKIGTQIKKENV